MARQRKRALALCMLTAACSDTTPELLVGRVGVAAAERRGRLVFAKNCVICHGEHGDGHGARHAHLTGRAQDLTDPAWRARTSPAAILDIVRNGKPRTSMPSWRSLSSDELGDVVAYVASLAARSQP